MDSPAEIPVVDVTGVPDPLPPGLPVIDVREQEEWDAGHIEGARHIPLAELPGRLDEVPTGQSLLVCHVGGRSAQATAYLQQQGHDAVNLEGGMDAWEAAGRPTVTDSGGTSEGS